MSWSSITALTCLLCSVMTSAGRVSPPRNLSVTFLDFRGEVKWSPGIGNPPGTTYTVEIQPVGDKWSRLQTCTDIESTRCRLNISLNMTDLMDSYYIRVKALWGGSQSSWIRLNTVQPYGNSLLSAPTLNVSVQDRDIYVHVSMPQLVLSVLPNLRYNVQVSEGTSGDHEEVNFAVHNDWFMRSCEMLKESTFVFVCKTLNLGHRYCVRAAAIHRQQQTKPHHSSVKCVDVPDNASHSQKDILMHAAMATALLLVIISLIVISTYIYMKLRFAELIPNSLKVAGGAHRILMAFPTEAPSLLVHVITPSLRSGTTLQEYLSSCGWGYECRVAISNSGKNADFPLHVAHEGELEEQHLSPNLYAGTMDEGVQGNDFLEERTNSTKLLLDKRDYWQPDQGPFFLDVPISSVNSPELWASPGESDCDSTEGKDMDLGPKLLGQSPRISAGDLSDSLKTLIEPEASSTCPTGYEPRHSPTSHEPIPFTRSPSPMFEQSVLYLEVTRKTAVES